MRWMSEDHIRRWALPVGMPARWAPRRQRAVRTPAAPEREGSIAGALVLSPSPARSTRTGALAARSDVIGVRAGLPAARPEVFIDS